MNITGNFTEDTLKNIWKVNQENKKLKKQLEAYENMRKEAIEYIEDKMELTKECPQDLLNILNKVGSDK